MNTQNVGKKPGRGSQLWNQLKAVVGARSADDPSVLAKLLEDPAVKAGFLKQSQAIHAGERGTDSVERGPMSSSAPRATVKTGARWIDPGLRFQFRNNLLATPMRV